MWRCDSLVGTGIETTWHACEDTALAEASRLRFSGRTSVVAWMDSAIYEGLQ